MTGIANWLAAERLPKHKHTACKLIEFFRSKITSCSASLLRLRALKSPRAKMDKAQLRFQGWNEVCISGSTKSEKEGGKSGDGRNKYLKERLPSQLHRAEMWKRQSKQAWSLGWLGVLWGRKRKRGRKTEWAWNKRKRWSEHRQRQEEEGGEKKVAGKMGSRRSRMTGCKTTANKFYREQRRRMGVKWKFKWVGVIHESKAPEWMCVDA